MKAGFFAATSPARASALAATWRGVLTLAFVAAGLAGLAGAGLARHAAAQTPAPSAYRLGIFPFQAPRQMVEQYGPVAVDIEAALGHVVRMETAPSFAGFSRELAAARYDIAYIQPFDYLAATEKYGYLPVARIDGMLVAQIMVRQDSPYQTIQSLRGTSIALPPAPSANARLVLRALHDHQLLPGRDVEVRHFSTHDSCLQQVWAGLASACGTSSAPIMAFEQRMQAKLRSVFDTPAIPQPAFVVHRRVPAEHRARLQKMILAWSDSDAGRKRLQSLGDPGYVVPKPDDYEVLRRFDLDPLIAATQVAVAAPKELTFGVFPVLGPRLIAARFAAAQAALSRASSLPVHLRTAASYDSFGDALASSNFDVVLVQPFDFARASRHGYLPLAGMVERLQGSFFVLEGSPHRQIADLRGQLVAMPPEDSAQAWLGRQALLKAGLVPGRDVTVEHRRNHESCLTQLQRSAAAACVTAERNLAVVPGDLALNVRSVGQTESVPGVLYMAHQRLPLAMRERLAAEIVGWKSSQAGRDILREANFGEFAPVNVADYQALPKSEATR